MDRSIRSRTSSTSSVRSPGVPSTPTPTPTLSTQASRVGGPGGLHHRAPSPDQLAASLSRLRAERALSNPATPAPTPSPYHPHLHHSLHPDAILDSLATLGGDEGIASCSVPGTPAPTPYSPSPGHHLDPGQIAASIARLREEGVSTVNSLPTTPSGTPAGYQVPLGGVHNLGVIPEHLAEGINNSLAGRGQDEGLESGSNPCTPTPTPFSPSPAGHHSVIAEQLAAGINRLRVETEGMSSGGSTGMPATPAPTPFSHGPGGVRPEDLAASISRLSVIQEADAAPAINILEASTTSDPVSPGPTGSNPNNLSNYFGTPQSSGDSIFDQLASPRSRATSESQGAGGGFTDITINTPVKRAPEPSKSPSPAAFFTPSPGQPPANSTPNLGTPAQGLTSTPTLAPCAPGQEAASPAEIIPVSLPVTQATDKGTPGSETLNRPESPNVARDNRHVDDMCAAWIPSPTCREVLAAMATTPGTFYPQRDQLTLPGVSAGSEQGDPVRDAVAKYQGDSEASKRQVLGCDGVTADTRGLLQLVSAGNYRSAVNMTAQLLEMYGQGCGKSGQISKHSHTSLQIWWIRLALLVKLKQFSTAEAEAASFGDLENPDLFYQYYPELYPNRRGSLAPWSLRLLLAELPMYNNKQVLAMNKMFKLRRMIQQIISNLEKGLNADGEVMLADDAKERRRIGLEMWKERERQVLYSLVNCSVLHQDYESAVKCLEMLKGIELPENMSSLYAAYGRVYLQLGNLSLADNCFSQAAKTRDSSAAGQLEAVLDSAFLAVGQGHFQVALERFLAGEQLVSSSGDVSLAKMISNNIAVCLLYVGRLKDGLQRLERDVTQDPSNIQGNMMLNLCTLYELESSYAMQKKIGLLGMVSQYSSDSFNINMLKL